MITRIVNGLIWSEDTLQQKTLVLDGEKIIDVLNADVGDEYFAERSIDASGMWILPGGIDFHVHISEGAESFFPGTCCAAAGGITTVFDMAPFHECITVDQLLAKAAEAEKACVVDIGLIAGIVIEQGDLAHLQELTDAGAAYFKVFQPSEPPMTTETLWKSIQAAARTGLRLGLHAEDPGCIDESVTGENPFSFAHSRPAVAETSVVAQAIEMARYAGSPLHICHISTGRTAELVAWGKAHGVDVTCEVPIHFLLLDESAFLKYGARVKTTPPLRSKSDVDQLWQALSDGVIDILACDHYTESLVPHSVNPEEIQSAAAGIAGLELSLPLLLNAVLEGRLSLKRFIELTAEKPAEIAHIESKKGRTSPGYDADLVFWDPKQHWTVNRKIDFSRIETTPYKDWNLQGIVSQTWVRGEPVWNGKSILKAPSYGRWVKSENK